MTASLIIKYAIELIAVLLLALGIKGLSKVRSARGANQLAAVAMGLAVVGLLFNYIGTTGIAAAAAALTSSSMEQQSRRELFVQLNVLTSDGR